MLNHCSELVIQEIANAQSIETKGKETNIVCPICGDKITVGRYDYECKCGFKSNKTILGTVINEETLEKVISGKSPELTFKSIKTGKDFKAKLIVDFEGKKLKFQLSNSNADKEVSTKYKCPKCGKGLVRRESSKKKGTFWWGCSGFPSCKEMFMDQNGEPKFNKE